ncbi:adhesion G protein-coupled receptor E5 [Clupea harengus]|uniref:Adhesion G protein-coupled receptor E5 n=1 Tax=Clupea harengus TaxID=7950 RepID=A0A6P8G6G5_CLUHA|nr:adhesion G protein-coupled receptor E5 [Clupea harengus]
MRYGGHLVIWELQLVLLFLVKVKAEDSTAACPEGYISDAKAVCVDENECNTDEDEPSIPCGDNAKCFNTEGSYYCQCGSGFRSTKGSVNFTGENPDKCQDINECTVENIDCGPNAACVNNEGSYGCVCEIGFRASNGKETFLDGKGVTCQDINECTVDDIDCGPNAACVNNAGSYACFCEVGFVTSSGGTFSDGQKCQDKDECALNTTICGGNARCYNNQGSYYCICNPGFSSNNKTGICEDTNECEITDICVENAKCNNIPGGHYCVCNPGFRLGSGNTNFTTKTESCEDICNMDAAICGGGACRQGPDGHECVCHKGYTNYGFNQEACTALSCDGTLDDVSVGQTLPELEALHSMLSGLCMRLTENNATGTSAQKGALDGEALLMQLLSLIDNLLSKGPLRDHKQVTFLLSAVEGALKQLGQLLNYPKTKKSTKYVEVELLVERGDSSPTGNVSLLSENAQLDTHWETATGAAFSGFPTVALLTYKNLEESTNDYFGVTPDKANQRFQINSKVVTATVSNANTTQLAKNITLSFPHLNSKEEQHKCVYWDHEGGVWSDRGCTVVTSGANHTVCSCSHLSSFAVLMALYEVEDTFELLMITWVGMSLSLVCLLTCILTFACCRSIQNTRNTIHLHLSLSLFIASVIFLAGISRTENQTGCALVAGMLHYFYLASFCWMCLEGVQLFRMVVLVFNTTLRSRYMMAAGYGVPALIVAISAMVNAKGYGSKRLCWFDVKENGFIWSFLGPVIVIIAANVFFFLITVYKLAEKFSSLNPDLNNLRKIKVFTTTAVAQLAVLGSMWIFGCFQFNKSTMAMSYIFTFLNSLQGVLMFVMHCLLNKQVREEYGKFMSCICAPHKTKYSDFSGSNQSKTQTSKSAQNTGESHI